jgi:hypothetical protein
MSKRVQQTPAAKAWSKFSKEDLQIICDHYRIDNKGTKGEMADRLIKESVPIPDPVAVREWQIDPEIDGSRDQSHEETKMSNVLSTALKEAQLAKNRVNNLTDDQEDDDPEKEPPRKKQRGRPKTAGVDENITELLSQLATQNQAILKVLSSKESKTTNQPEASVPEKRASSMFVPILPSNATLGLPDHLVKKARAGEFVDLNLFLQDDLCAAEEPLTISLSEDSTRAIQLVSRSKANSRKITDISTWTEAWLNLTHVVTSVSLVPPSFSHCLFAYQFAITAINRDSKWAKANAYDLRFRRTHTDYHLFASYDHQILTQIITAQPTAHTGPQLNQQPNKRSTQRPICIRFNRGQCTSNSCNYIHACTHCHMINHGASTCRSLNNNTRNNDNTTTTDNSNKTSNNNSNNQPQPNNVNQRYNSNQRTNFKRQHQHFFPR